MTDESEDHGRFREPPKNLSAERAVLGAVLAEELNPANQMAVLAEISAALNADDFHLPAHREIFEALIALGQRKAAVINAIILNEELRTRGALPKLENEEVFVFKLAADATPGNSAFWIGRVKDAASRRRIILRAAEAAARAYGTDGDAEEIASALADDVTKIARGGRLQHFLRERFRNVGDLGLLDKQAQPRQYLLNVGDKGFLPAGRVGMLAAEGGAGKSWAVIQLAVAVASGRQWFGTFSVNPKKRGKVLLVLAEEELEEVHYRIEQACRDLASDDGKNVRLNVYPMALAGEDVELIRSREEIADGHPTETRVFRELMRLIEDEGPWSLIVFDPLSRFAAADTETDNAAAARMIRTFEKFAHAPGRPSVLFAHHTTKTSRKEGARDATAARGASALTDNGRWQANLEPRARFKGAPRLVDFHLVKSNYGWIAEVTVLSPDPDRSGLLTLADGRTIMAWEEANKAKAKKGKASTGEKTSAADQNDDDDDPHHGYLG